MAEAPGGPPLRHRHGERLSRGLHFGRRRGPRPGTLCLSLPAWHDRAMRTDFQLRAGRLEEVKGEVARELPLTVYVDGDLYAGHGLGLPEGS